MSEALAVDKALRERSLPTWIDYLSIPLGQFFIREITEALVSASVFVLVCPRAHSFWTQKEINLATKLRSAGSLSRIFVFDPNHHLDLALDPDEVFSEMDVMVARIVEIHDMAVSDHHPTAFESICNVTVEHYASLDSALWLGYSDELRMLDDWWLGSSARGWVTGVGGVGKTSLVATWLRVLQRFGFRHVEPIRVNWISLTRREDGIVSTIARWLASNRDAKALVIVDDVTSESDEQYASIRSLADASNARLLAISRHTPQGSYTTLSVGGLAERDAERILVAAGISGSSESKRALLERLAMLPLALAQTVAYMRHTNTALEEYIQKFDEAAGKDLGRSGKPKRIEQIFLDSVRQLPSDCIYVLMVLSRQPANYMNLADLRDVVALKDSLASLEARHPESLDGCLRKLAAHSLIQYQADNGDIRIHPLIADLCAEIPEAPKEEP